MLSNEILTEKKSAELNDDIDVLVDDILAKEGRPISDTQSRKKQRSDDF